MSKDEVVERDFRMPEYRDAKVEDYEFRSDGKIVRKDRWETAVHTIRHLVGNDGREFEIAEIVQAVRLLADANEGWRDVIPDSPEIEDWPEAGQVLEVRLADGSVLRNAGFYGRGGAASWQWRGVETPQPVVAWREQPGPPEVP